MIHHLLQHQTLRVDRVLLKRVLCLSVLLLATRVYAQSTGPEFPDPGNAHMSRDKQQAYEDRVTT